jgi:methionine aminotransferase
MNGVTIFTEMSALAQQHNAINLSQGFPDFELQPALGEFLQEAFQSGFNQYAPMAGLPLLQNSIVQRIKEKYETSLSSMNNITVTPGATYGIYCALVACIQPGDEVIILEPAYDSYAQNIVSLGGKVVRVSLHSKTFEVDWQKVKDAVSTETKAIIINTPHNPSGAMWQASDYEELKKIVRKTDIKIISDEVYDHLTFEGKQHYSLLQDEELFDRTFVIFSFGKVLQATGWKIGYVAASPQLTNNFRRAHQYIGFSVNSVSQYAIAKFLMVDHKLDELSNIFESKRDLMLNEFAKLPLVVPFKSMGSYFQLFSFANLSDESDRAYAKVLVNKAKVASIPLSPFFHEESNSQMLRFCFAKNDETIRQAAKNLTEYFST